MARKYRNYDDPLVGLSTERLKRLIANLRKPGPKETHASALIRVEARRVAEERLRQRTSSTPATVRAGDDPEILRWKRTQWDHVLSEAEVRERLQAGLTGWEEAEPPPVPDEDDDEPTASPAAQALARFARGDAARVQDLAHSTWPSWTDQTEES